MKVLVIGARKGSLGEAVVGEAGWRLADIVLTAGVSGDEDLILDATDVLQVQDFFEDRPAFDRVVCTVGVNPLHDPVGSDPWNAPMRESYEKNVIGPLNLLRAYLDNLPKSRGHFVAISSNSAHVARSQSLPYCASKAALSMSIRCAARYLAGDGVLVYGWEFGLLAGTPMTQATQEAFGGVQPLSRIPGGENGLPVEAAAQHVAETLRHDHIGLNGVLLRVDGGEQ